MADTKIPKEMLSVRLPVTLIAAVKADAEAKGQALTVWLARTLDAALRKESADA